MLTFAGEVTKAVHDVGSVRYQAIWDKCLPHGQQARADSLFGFSSTRAARFACKSCILGATLTTPSPYRQVLFRWVTDHYNLDPASP